LPAFSPEPFTSFLLFKKVGIKIHRNILLCAVFGAWSLTLKEKCVLGDFESKMLRRIFE
jgi:hypothetical protein